MSPFPGDATSASAGGATSLSSTNSSGRCGAWGQWEDAGSQWIFPLVKPWCQASDHIRDFTMFMAGIFTKILVANKHISYEL